MSDQAAGVSFGSKEEEYFYLALQRLRRAFIYQYSIYGGHSRRGGYVLDFLIVDTAPQSTAVNIQGAYWHKDNQTERYEFARIEQWCRKAGVRYIEVKAEVLTDVDAAANVIREDVL